MRGVFTIADGHRVARSTGGRCFLPAIVVLLVTGAVSPVRAGISDASGRIQVWHHTGEPMLAIPNPNFDRVPGGVVHLNDNTDFTDWDPWPASFSLNSQADLHRSGTNLVIGSTSVTGRFVYQFTPGGTDYFVGWPGRIRLTQFNNPFLNEVKDPSNLRVDFAVTYHLDEDGILAGGLPIAVNFRGTGTASFARYDYYIMIDSAIADPNAEPITLMGGDEFGPGNFNFQVVNPGRMDNPPMQFFAPNGLQGGMGQSIIVSGFLQLQVKNDDVPAEFILENLILVPEPTAVHLALLGILAAACRRDRVFLLRHQMGSRFRCGFS